MMNANEEIKEFLKSKGLDFDDDNDYIYFIKTIISELIVARNCFYDPAKEPIDIVEKMKFKNKYIEKKGSCGDLRRLATVPITSNEGTFLFYLGLYEKFITLYNIDTLLDEREPLIIEMDNKIDFSMYPSKSCYITFMYHC